MTRKGWRDDPRTTTDLAANENRRPLRKVGGCARQAKGHSDGRVAGGRFCGPQSRGYNLVGRWLLKGRSDQSRPAPSILSCEPGRGRSEFFERNREAMKLIDYVGGFLSPKFSAQAQSPGFPPALELPDKLITGWHDIYKDGERIGCEFGESLTLLDNGKIKRSDAVKGLATSCNVPRTENDLEFGDMHSHPSFSIGHVNGYSAHSFEDWMIFRYHLSKPVFIRFVASGDYFYAVVYRKGVSEFDEVLIDKSMAFHARKLDEYSNRFFKEAEVDDSGNNQNFVEDLDEAREVQKMLEKKRGTPGFGEYLMKLAGLNNVELAKRLNFGFYVGDRKKDKGLLRLKDRW
jgi:hypothetical protein